MKDDKSKKNEDKRADDIAGGGSLREPSGGGGGTRPEVVNDSVSEDGNTGVVVQDGIEIKPVEHTMEDYFLRYSMSVIVDRALPDVRDGLKPVNRRIL